MAWLTLTATTRTNNQSKQYWNPRVIVEHSFHRGCRQDYQGLLILPRRCKVASSFWRCFKLCFLYPICRVISPASIFLRTHHLTASALVTHYARASLRQNFYSYNILYAFCQLLLYVLYDRTTLSSYFNSIILCSVAIAAQYCNDREYEYVSITKKWGM